MIVDPNASFIARLRQTGQLIFGLWRRPGIVLALITIWVVVLAVKSGLEEPATSIVLIVGSGASVLTLQFANHR